MDSSNFTAANLLSPCGTPHTCDSAVRQTLPLILLTGSENFFSLEATHMLKRQAHHRCCISTWHANHEGQQRFFSSQQQHWSITCLWQKWCSERFARLCKTKWSIFFCQKPFAPRHVWVRLHELQLLPDHTKSFFRIETRDDQKCLPHIAVFEHQHIVCTQSTALAVCTSTKFQSRYLFFQWLLGWSRCC